MNARDVILCALQKHGDMTVEEITTALGWECGRVQSAVVRQRREQPGEMFRIVDFESRAHVGQKRPAGVYSAAGGEDAVYAGCNNALAAKAEALGLKVVRVSRPVRTSPIERPEKPARTAKVMSNPQELPERLRKRFLETPRPPVPRGMLWSGLGDCVAEYARR